MKERQQKILDFIKEHTDEKGYPPTLREVGVAVGLASSSTVHGHIERLEKKGLVSYEPSSPRTLRVLIPDQR